MIRTGKRKQRKLFSEKIAPSIAPCIALHCMFLVNNHIVHKMLSIMTFYSFTGLIKVIYTNATKNHSYTMHYTSNVKFAHIEHLIFM